MSLFSPFSWHAYVCASVCVCVCFLACVCDCIWSSDLCFVTHGSPRHLGLPRALSCDPIHFYPVRSSASSLSFPLLLSSLPPSLSFFLSLSFVYLLMCEIILGWRDGFLPEGLSGGVSLLFNNRLGVYVYLSVVIDYRLVLDNKLHSGGQTDGKACFIHPSGITPCLVSANYVELWNKEAIKLLTNFSVWS